MNHLDMRASVDAVLSQYGDPERGHSVEDGLLWEFVRLVADPTRQTALKPLSATAKELLRLDQTNRIRWYS